MKSFRFAPLMIAATLAIGALTGCANGLSGADSTGGPVGVNDAYDGASPQRAGSEAASESGGNLVATDQHVISTVEVTLRAQQPDAAADRITAAITELGGSVESLSVHRASGDAPAGSRLTLRVPPDRLDAAIEAFGEIGEVVSQTRSAQDVTTEYVDLEARIGALETSVKRLNDLMAGAATTSELIEAEGALTQRQQELDGLRAQFTALDGQVTQATIWVTITSPSVLPGGGPGSFWEGLLAGLNSLGLAGSGALVLTGILLPWLAVAAVVAVAVVLIVRSRKSRRARASRPDGQIPGPR